MPLEITERKPLDENLPVDDEVALDHEQREKARFRAVTRQGNEARVFLERGKPPRIGEILVSACGKTVRVIGKDEELAVAVAERWSDFNKACYHLGNRHVKAQIGERQIKFKPDHVLEDMLKGLGLEIHHSREPFVPEPGAYDHAHSR